MSIEEMPIGGMHELGKTKCVSCNQELELGMHIGGQERKPKAGDSLICGKCGAILRFKEDMTTEIYSQEEFDRLPMGIRRAAAEFVRLTRKRAEIVQ